MSAYAAANRVVPAPDVSDGGRHAVVRRLGRSTRFQPHQPEMDRMLTVLVDRIADCVAEAVMARLGAAPTEEPAAWLDTREAADYLGVHRDTVRRLAAERAIPSEQEGPGCKLYFLRSDLDGWRRNGGRSAHLAAAVAA